MSIKKWIALAATLTALVLLVILVVRAGPPGQQPGPQGGLSAQGTLGTGFTYQGQLESGGDPVTGDCEMAFRLYDEESGGNQVSSAITTTVPISDGLFTVSLDFGGSAFDGDARWLELAVRCPAGSGPYTTLTPRQPLSPTPYALYATRAMTAAIASGVELGVITPRHLNGITHNGTSGQVLASNGSGGFAWQTTTARQLVQDFVVAGGESVSAGDVVSFLEEEVYGPTADYDWGTESVFNAANSQFLAVCTLSATDFVVAYMDVGNSDYGTAIVGTVSGGTVIWGTPSVFNTAQTVDIGVSPLSGTNFVVVYSDAGNSWYGTARVGTASGRTLSWGTPEVFNPAEADYTAVSSLSATDIVVAYGDGGTSYHGTAITGTVSGGTVSFGTPEVFNAAATWFIDVSALSATDFVVVYQDKGSSDYGTARVGTVGGGTLSFGTPSVFNADPTEWIAVTDLSASDFVVVYQDDGNSSYGTVRVGTVSGGTVSWGPELVFNTAPTDWNAVSRLSGTDFVIAYQDWDSSTYGMAIVGTISGGTVNWGRESVYNAAGAKRNAVISLPAADFLVIYRDLGNSSHGTAIVGDYMRRLVGTATTEAGDGETVTVIITGVSDVHSGLVPGETYYLQGDGSLGLTPTAYRVGRAISKSELILDQIW
jgi:hypothetical protein